METQKISKTLSYILRHKPEKFNIVLDRNGWAKVEDILNQLETDQETLDLVVENNDKKRFAYNKNKTHIRANQGHTINVDIELKKIVPPFKLYHGTKKEFLKNILKIGLKPMKRNHIHLSPDIETATNVAGRRKGDNIILEINARHMHTNKVDIYLSVNGVYLVDYIDPKYITVV